jgi:DNA ligase (NAD+)
VLYALGIRDVGESTARTLARHFGALDPLLAADEETLRQVPDIGPIVAARIAHFFAESHNREVIAALRANGVHLAEGAPQRASEGPASPAQTVVLTGGPCRRCSRDARRREARSARREGVAASRRNELRRRRRGRRQQAGQGAGARRRGVGRSASCCIPRRSDCT